MRQWLVSGFIASYLAFLGWGIVSNILKFTSVSHPVMYFTVWDMFCGWQAYETRVHIVAEGESGQLYSLSTPPWKSFTPFGDLPRVNYDALGNSFRTIAMSTLRNTQHEPVRRVLVVEECWQKKFNLPDSLWDLRYDEPKDPKNYFWLRTVFSPEGELQYSNIDFVAYHMTAAVTENPRLKSDAQRGRPFFPVNPVQRSGSEQVSDPTRWAGNDNSLQPYTN